MILDTIRNIDMYRPISKNIDTALMFLLNTDFSKKEIGKYEIDGDNVYALVLDYETKREFEDKWEAHRKYYDIQFIIEGIEKIAVSNIIDMSPVSDYIEKEDYQFFKGNGGKFILRKNNFILLGPEDVHQPAIHIGKKISKVKKVVVKAMI